MPRLAVAVGLSLALHLAGFFPLLAWKVPRVGPPEAMSPVAVRLIASEPPPPPAIPTPLPRPAAKPRPPRRPAAPPALDAKGTPLPAGRVPYVAVRSAFEDVPDEFVAEKLRPAQRRVPRASTLVRPAELAGRLRVAYPPELLARGEKGSVLLEAFISTGGRVDDVLVLELNGDPQLAKAAGDALRKARFRPAEDAGGKTRSRVTLRLDFRYE